MTRWLVLLFAPLLLGAAPIPAPAPPQRIVSLNLCADQLLIALADPGQIAALTRLSRDPQLSAAAMRAATLPVSRGSAEEVLALRPDLLIASPFGHGDIMARMRDSDVATLELPSAESLGAIIDQIRVIAAAVGHPERGERLIARMEARLARLGRPGGGRVAAYYQRRGFLTGTGTLIDDLMARLGLVNLADRLNRPVIARVTLEQIALARPDFLIMESDTRKVRDRGTEMLHHPLLAPIARLHIPQAWTVCGGPAYVRAAESLAAQLAR